MNMIRFTLHMAIMILGALGPSLPFAMVVVGVPIAGLTLALAMLSSALGIVVLIFVSREILKGIASA